MKKLYRVKFKPDKLCYDFIIKEGVNDQYYIAKIIYLDNKFISMYALNEKYTILTSDNFKHNKYSLEYIGTDKEYPENFI